MKSNKVFTHKDLCDIAVKWLKKSNSQGGHGCTVAISECKSGWTGEIPDAIGFRATGWDDGSVVVECKTSRSDFLADAKKPHRMNAGCGNWRYFLAPQGIIGASDLPDQWGLIEVSNRGAVKPVVGPAAFLGRDWRKAKTALEEFKKDADRDREMFIVVRLLSRIGDPEELNKKLKCLYSEKETMRKEIERLKFEKKTLTEKYLWNAVQ